MNMISLPRPECPYCHEAMRRWPLGQHMLVCDTCRRPIVRYLAAPSRRLFRLRPLYSVINAIALFILVATFTMLNLFIGVIVETMQTLHARSDKSGEKGTTGPPQVESTILAEEIRSLRAEVLELKHRLQDSSK